MPEYLALLATTVEDAPELAATARKLVADAVLADVWCSDPAPIESGRHVRAHAAIVRGSSAEPLTGDHFIGWFGADRVLAAYRVDPRRQWDAPTLATAAPVTQFSGVVRAASLDRPSFAEHWSERHTALARVHHPGIGRYVQYVVEEALLEDTAVTPSLDGIAELAFASEADRTERFYDSEAGREIIRADVARFLDLRSGWRVLAADRRLDPGP